MVNTVYEDSFTNRIKEVIRRIPKGKVATYGQVASIAGNYRAARQTAWVLHVSSEKDNLPWHRVINSQGKISLKPGDGYETQKQLLMSEGIIFDQRDRIPLERFLWNPEEDL